MRLTSWQFLRTKESREIGFLFSSSVGLYLNGIFGLLFPLPHQMRGLGRVLEELNWGDRAWGQLSRQGQQTFCKGSEEVQKVSVAGACVDMVVGRTETDGQGWLPIKLDVQRQTVGWVWPTDHSLPTPARELGLGWPGWESVVTSESTALNKCFRFLGGKWG